MLLIIVINLLEYLEMDINILTNMPTFFWHLGNIKISACTEVFFLNCIKNNSSFIENEDQNSCLTLKINNWIFLSILVSNIKFTYNHNSMQQTAMAIKPYWWGIYPNMISQLIKMAGIKNCIRKRTNFTIKWRPVEY